MDTQAQIRLRTSADVSNTHHKRDQSMQQRTQAEDISVIKREQNNIHS